MEIVLSFEKKELIVKDNCNFLELHKRLKKLLGDELEEWDIVAQDTKWYYQWWPVYPWKDITYVPESGKSNNPYEIKYGSTTIAESVLAISDNVNAEAAE